MIAKLIAQVCAALPSFSADTRLYALTIGDDPNANDSVDLLVEAFLADDELQKITVHDVIVVATDAHIRLADLLGERATLHLSLADGSRCHITGDISSVCMLGSEGGFARYRLRLSPWMWRLGQVRNSRVWQDKSVIEIVDTVFAAYEPLALWRWSDETLPFMDGAMPRSYCCQYRESDLSFVHRLLAEEGLAWRFEQSEAGTVAVIFADSTQVIATPEDPSSKADGGIRFHSARAGEHQDTVQALSDEVRLTASLSKVLSYDYKSKQVIGASSPSILQHGVLASLESMDVPGQYAYASLEQARRYADLQMQGREARAQLWRGRSTVRTMRAGTRVTLLDAPLKRLGSAPAFTLVRVTSVGVNNLPSKAQQALAELFGPIPELLQEVGYADVPDDFALAIAQAEKTGYANCFEAVAADVSWRPQLPGCAGRAHPVPTALGAHSAIVVGTAGNDQPSGADELYCDRLGRVRIRFHWQEETEAGCWVRVAQRSAGGGMGSQFLPRIGQEVLVQFLENDIERPIIVGALYNGQGAGGIAPTPGGQALEGSQDRVFESANDHRPSAQGNTAAGNSPLWHGASGDSAGHRNGAAQWGLRTKEFGASGYNQLLFDDTDAQGRVQLRCSNASSELNLGHLVHAADNYRGGFRGQGAELRTDAYGAVRAGRGLLVSSYNMHHGTRLREPVGENTPCIAMLKQACKLAEAFSEAAGKHKTVELAAHTGSVKVNAGLVSKNAPPLKAMWTSVSGIVGDCSLAAAKASAQEHNTKPADDKLPHTSDAIIAISAKAGLGVVAGQSLQLASDEIVMLASGRDSQFVSGGQMRVHSGQALGVLGGVVAPGEGGTGMQWFAARGAIDVQAQSDTMALQGRDEVSVISANAHIDWAAAKSISLSTAGGANITIDGGNITFQCPGKMLIHAGRKSFTGPVKRDYLLPVMPVSLIKPEPEYKLESTFAFDQLTAFAHSSTKGEFIGFLLPVFGYDIPARTYIKLYDGLHNGTISNAKIVVRSGGNYPAEFENTPPEIRVHRAAVDRSVKNNEEAWELLTALLHEFGHYIDAVLRHQLADKNPDGTSTLAFDSDHDEGAKYAYAVAAFDLRGKSNSVFAHLTSPTYSGPLRVNFSEVRALIKAAQNKEAQLVEKKDGTVEFFPASPEHKDDKNSYGHENIEVALIQGSPFFLPTQIRKQIYFGNWLRDNSQILDPKVVRGAKDAKDLSRHLSWKAWTRLVDFLSKKKFGNSPEDRAIFAVTEKRLGVYRALEHIDNPKSLGTITRVPQPPCANIT